MGTIRTSILRSKLFVWLAVAVAGSVAGVGPCWAQDAAKKEEPAKKEEQSRKEQPAKEEESKVVSVEVTPEQGTVAVGSKMQFKAVGKDASGQVLPDKVKMWFAAPFDSSAAEENGQVSFVQPGEITVGALIGKKVGYAHVVVSKPHIARIDVAFASTPLAVGASHLLSATPRNANDDPRSDIALTWASGNLAIASVDANGLVHALKEGKATIRVSGDGASGETTVHVSKNKFAGLAVSPASATAKTRGRRSFYGEKAGRRSGAGGD